MNEVRPQFNPEINEQSKDEKIALIRAEYEQKFNEWKEQNPDQPLDEMPSELYPVFIPTKLWSEAENVDDIKIVAGKAGSGILFKAVRNHDQPLTNLNRLNAESGNYREDSKTEILMRCHMLNHGKDNNVLYVMDFDSIEHKGIGTEFYTDILPEIAKKTEIRYIIGQNNSNNISFFTQSNGLNRSLITDLKPEFAKYLFPQLDPNSLTEHETLNTIQFLYEEDKEKFLK